MKLKKRLKGVAELKKGPVRYPPYMAVRKAMEGLPPESKAAVQRYYTEQEKRRNAVTPEECKAAGVMFNGTMPDKGKKDGSCNRSACQMPLLGKPQFWMKDYTITNGRLYYCRECEHEFSKWDRVDRPGEPLRCTPDEDNEKLPDSVRYW